MNRAHAVEQRRDHRSGRGLLDGHRVHERTLQHGFHTERIAHRRNMLLVTAQSPNETRMRVWARTLRIFVQIVCVRHRAFH
jgi:hypothetical protein